MRGYLNILGVTLEAIFPFLFAWTVVVAIETCYFSYELSRIDPPLSLLPYSVFALIAMVSAVWACSTLCMDILKRLNSWNSDRKRNRKPFFQSAIRAIIPYPPS